MNEKEQHEDTVKVVKREGISAVWLVPLVALVFGVWLIVKTYSERGVFITITFDNANGIIVGKTQVKHKGLTVGVVRDVEVSEDLQNVNVEVEMIGASEASLTDKTLFWYVTADVSLQGVSGLETLLSGSYINMQPDMEGKGLPSREFVAVKEEPPLAIETPGLHINVTARTLGSIKKNSPVSFKQISVGYVVGHRYEEEQNLVSMQVYIEPEYAHLVKGNTRFWNVSGFHITGSLAHGVSINTDSLASIISGGIAFDNLPYEQDLPVVSNGHDFPLHDDFLAAQMGHTIRLVLGWNTHVDVGTPIVYQGLTIGRIESLEKIDPESRKITAVVKMNPRVEPYLTSDSQFYISTPTLDLGGVTNLNQVLIGSQVSVRPAMTGEPRDTFTVYSEKPAYSYSVPGLHLILEAENVESIKAGSGVYFEQQQVGSIQAIKDNGPNRFLVHIYIEPKYQSYVSATSRFWNASGVRITGGLQGFEVQTQTLQSILKGGIGFDSGEKDDLPEPENGDVYQLFINKQMAKERVTFDLVLPTAKNIRRGMRLLFRGEKIGSLHGLTRHEDKVYAHLGLLPEFEFILREDSQFWLAKTSLSLAGLQDTEAIFGGSYFGVNVGQGQPAKQFVASMQPPKKPNTAEGMQLTLIAETGRAANPGSPVSYRGIVVGQVDNVSLNEQGDKVHINITIETQYRSLIHSATRFYSASGITVVGGLNKLIVKTESIDAILSGGVSFFNGVPIDGSTQVQEGEHFKLYDNVAKAESAGLPITIYFNELEGLHENLEIRYKDQTIGMIERLVYDEQSFGAKAVAFLNDNGKKFAVEGTQFWLVQPKVGLVGFKDLDALIEPFVVALPGKGSAKTNFKAEDMAPPEKFLPYGLNIKLTAAQLGSVRVGDPVLYRQLKVGEVIGVDLSKNADFVDIYLNIATKYARLVSAKSQFWNASGVEIEAGLLSGVKVETESLESLIAGGVAFATPPAEEAHQPVENGHEFLLHDEAKEKWQDWRPRIDLSQPQ